MKDWTIGLIIALPLLGGILEFTYGCAKLLGLALGGQ